MSAADTLAFEDPGTPVVGAHHHVLEEALARMARRVSSGGRVGPQRNRLVGLTSRLPPELGVGSWDYVQLAPNLILSLTNVEYRRDTWINIEGDDTFKVRVVLGGRLRASRDPHDKPLQAPFVYVESYPGSARGGYTILAGRIQMIVLHCRADALHSELGLSDYDLPAPISDLYCQNASPSPTGNAVRIGAEVMRAASDMFAAAHQYPAQLAGAFLRAKSQEILCSVLRQLSAPENDATAHGLRSRDVNRIYEARDIVLARLDSPPSLAELSRQVGVCQTKLKAGFKAIFGATVFEYIRARQMESALELLLGTDQNISEIAYEVGYKYPANFTHAFRKHFGYLPTEVRQPSAPNAAELR